jgi:hypothetical protein
MTRYPPPAYHIEMEFDAPREFAFRWCTDYRADDATKSKERFERRVLRRTGRQVVFEDMGWTPAGWIWRHTVVTLRPPGRWHADSYGSFRTGEVDYALTPLPDGRCHFSLTFRRRPTPVHPDQPTKRGLERELTQMWTNYGRALARDYRSSRSGRDRRR